MHPAGPLLVVAGAGSGKTRVITFRLARAGRDRRRSAAHPGRHLHQQGGGRDARARRQAARRALGSARAGCGSAPSTRTVGAPAAPVRRGGRAAQGLRHLRRRRSEAAARARADRPEGARAHVPRAPGAVGRSTGPRTRASRPTLPADDYFDDVVGKAYTPLRRAAGGGQRHRLRRPAAGGAAPVRERDAGGARSWPSASTTCWSTSSRTPTACSTGWCAACRAARSSITVVGDEDQSIYQWRGADIRNILDFERDHPGAGVVKLEQNYRSTRQHPARRQRHHRAATPSGGPKRLFTEAGDGEPIVLFEGETERDEAEFVAARDRRRGLREDAGAARLRRLLPDQRAVARAGRGAARARPALRRRRRHALLRSRRDQGPDRLPARDRQPRRRAGAAADHQHPGARHRRRHRRARSASARPRAHDPGRVAGAASWRPSRRRRAASAAGAAQEGGRLRRADEAAAREGAGAGAGGAGREGAGGERLPRRAGRRGDAWRPKGASRTCSSSSAQMREYEREAEEPTLAGFLERIALRLGRRRLRSGEGRGLADDRAHGQGARVPGVFITGLEERIFPHARSVDDDSAVEEERRLCYVAVTRARKRALPVARAPPPAVRAGAARRPQPLPARPARPTASTRS